MPRADVVLLDQVLLVQLREHLRKERQPRARRGAVVLQHLDGLHGVDPANLVDERAPAPHHLRDLDALRRGVPGDERDAVDDRADDGLAHPAQGHVGRHAERLELDGGVVDGVVLGERAFERLRDFGAELGLCGCPREGVDGGGLGRGVDCR